jgi:hypothetical protein
VALVGIQARGFFLGTDGEAAAGGLLDEALVEVRMSLFEARRVEPLGQDVRVADHVLPNFHFLGVLQKHLLFDGVPQDFRFGGGFRNQFFKLTDFLDLADDFDFAHFRYLLLDDFGVCGKWWEAFNI